MCVYIYIYICIYEPYSLFEVCQRGYQARVGLPEQGLGAVSGGDAAVLRAAQNEATGIMYLESQVAQNNGPLHHKVAHSSLEATQNFGPRAFQIRLIYFKGC